jgi:hypothetical protein
MHDRMSVADARKHYEYNSARVSELVRQLGFAGIALVWVFRETGSNGPVLPRGLLGPGVLIVAALGFDFLQYVTAAGFWGAYARLKERADVEEFEAPAWINWGAIVLFWAKVIALLAAYGFLVRYLLTRLL